MIECLHKRNIYIIYFHILILENMVLISTPHHGNVDFILEKGCTSFR